MWDRKFYFGLFITTSVQEIRIKDLTKIFPGDPKRNIRDTIAVKDMDFVVPDGQLVGLVTKGKITYVDNSWNVQPVPNNVCKVDKINLIHYNMLWKPWIFEGIEYDDIFWEYAKQCPLYDKIVKIKNETTDECRANKLNGGKMLLEMAGVEAKDPNNYKNRFGA